MMVPVWLKWCPFYIPYTNTQHISLHLQLTIASVLKLNWWWNVKISRVAKTSNWIFYKMIKLSVSEIIEASSLYIFCCSSLLHITAANGARLALVAHSAHFTFNISATKNYLSEIIEPSLTLIVITLLCYVFCGSAGFCLRVSRVWWVRVVTGDWWMVGTHSISLELSSINLLLIIAVHHTAATRDRDHQSHKTRWSIGTEIDASGGKYFENTVAIREPL